jgi:hypothetical protein
MLGLFALKERSQEGALGSMALHEANTLDGSLIPDLFLNSANPHIPAPQILERHQ